MKKPALVIMAAGMGSRFGGLKQIEPVDEQGHIIIDFSLYDAYRAGFRDLVFIIKPEMEETFREVIGSRMEKYFHITYVHQTNDALPSGYAMPEGRVKPWGTGHAVLCCKDVLDGPFTVINADDFYERYTRGFLEGAQGGLTEAELEYLPWGAKLMTLECGIRFLTDYLDGDNYFRTHYPEQNLDCCRTQFKLVKDMEEQFEEMHAVVSKYAV